MNKESLIKEAVEYQAIGAEISHELAAKMVKDHHDKHNLDNSYSYIVGIEFASPKNFTYGHQKTAHGGNSSGNTVLSVRLAGVC